MVSNVISQLSVCFSIKNFDSLHYFFGVEVTSSSCGLFLYQQKYIRDILARTSMSDAKPVQTPIVAVTYLSLTNGSNLSNATEYR